MKTIQVGDQVGDYKVIDIAGSGGMGTVYKIEHVITKRVEAMKVLPLGLDSDHEQVQRFEREIRLQARLHHPNIVGLENAIRDAGSVALVMEFLEGQTLQRLIDAGPLPVETAVDFSMQVLHALVYAHENGVIHRDVSPANIIITPDRAAKLTDFGLALGVSDLRLSTSSGPMGSPWYMSPEQVKGSHELDARTDIYAMGAVLHEMLTGRKLFEEEGAFAVMRAHVEAEPRLPSSLNPKVPLELDDIVKTAVAKDPARRFASAHEFLLALQHFAVSSQAAPQPSPLRPTWHATVRQLTSRPPRMRGSRKALLLALAPAALLAGFCAVRLSGVAARRPVAEHKTPAATVSNRGADGSSAVTADVAVQAPGMVAPPPAAVLPPPEPPPVTEPSAGAVHARAQSPRKSMPRPAGLQQASELRITGGESQPIASMPTTEDSPHAVEAPEPPPLRTNSVAAPVPGPPPTPAGNSGLAPISQETAPTNPTPAGNRFVRALGKVNPFRRLMKHDDKPQIKQD
jgi:eukaryotic-like serine/threonine-protein kinase